MKLKCNKNLSLLSTPQGEKESGNHQIKSLAKRICPYVKLTRSHHRQTTLCVRGLRESMRVMNTSSENCTSQSHLGLNIPIKLHETLIDSCMVFFRLLGPSKASYSEINFSRWRLSRVMTGFDKTLTPGQLTPNWPPTDPLTDPPTDPPTDPL